MVAVRADPSRVYPLYLFAALRSSTVQDQIANMHVGTMIPHFKKGDFNKLHIPYPNQATQTAIGDLYFELSLKIELNRRMSETLEASARALFRDWFVNFGPTLAKVEGRPAYLAPDLWSLFPDRLDDDGVPEGWELRKVSGIAELKGGKQLEKSRIFKTGDIPVFGGAGIMGFTDAHNAEGYVISVGRVGAYCGQFSAHRGRAWINNNASYIRPLIPNIAEWLFMALREVDMDVIKKGAAQPFVSNGDIANLELAWPGKAVIGAFSGILEPLVRQMEACVDESRTLAALRDTLLPKLMSGEIRVRDAEAAVA
jgi:type I restriction enzyme S subunit